MVRGKKSKGRDVSADLIVSGHVDEWAEAAVDYIDDRLEPAARAAVQAHLDGCPACTARLEAQRGARALLSEVSLVDPPVELKSRVLDEVLLTSEAAQGFRFLPRRRSTRTDSRRRPALSPAGPWLPALAGVAAVVVLVLALTVSRGPGSLDETEDTVTAALSAEEGLTQTAADGHAEEVGTTIRATGVSDAATTVSSQLTASADAGEGATSFAALRPVGPYLQGEAEMASGLAEASTTAFFFFDPTEGVDISDEMASSITESFTSATGLRLVDGSLSSGVKAFAAFVPRDDSDALVNLLCSIADSQRLTVCLSLEPGPEVKAWADSMLEDAYSLPELSASLSADSKWSYTTSTGVPTTLGSATTTTLGTVTTTLAVVTTTLMGRTTTTKPTPPDGKDTNVLVVIFMAAQSQAE